MKQFITLVLGIVLVYSSFSGRAGDFYRIRSVPVKGAGRIAMRIIYAIAGFLLIAIAFSEQL